MKIRAAFFLCVIGIAAAQQPAVIRSETKLPLVDVVVTGKNGVYVNDLTAKDFQLLDGKKEQTITSVTGGSKGDAPVRQADYIVLLLDHAGLTAPDRLLAHQQASRFIDANAGPSRLMGVASVDGALRILQGFTDNAGRLKDAVTESDKVAVGSADAGNSAATGSGARYQAVRDLAVSLAALPGRKSVVLFTGSLPDDDKSALRAAIEACNRANVAVYPADVRSGSSKGSPGSDNGSGLVSGKSVARTVPTGGTGSNGSVGGFNTGSMVGGRVAADRPGESQEGMFPLASGTGGFVIRKSGELSAGLEKIAQEQGEHYALGYTPPDSKGDVCRSLKIKVDRGGTNVRARSSYCTGEPQTLLAAKTVEADLEKRGAGVQADSTQASMELPYFYVSPGAARVDLAMDIQPAAVEFEKRKTGAHAEINVLGTASTADGATAARFSDTLTLDFADGDARRQKPVHYEKQFKIAPGPYNFTLIFSAGAGSIGKLERPLTIEPWQTGQLGLSGLALSDELRGASVGNSAPAGLVDGWTPLTVKGTELVPSGANVFDKSGKAYSYVEVYSTAAATLDIRVLDSKTQKLRWNGRSKAEPQAGQFIIPRAMVLPIESLPSGFYELEITATDASDQGVKRTADFEIR